LKMVAYAVFVNTRREEGLVKSPIVYINLPFWNVADEIARDAAAKKKKKDGDKEEGDGKA